VALLAERKTNPTQTRVTFIAGCVDSGASGTLLPMSVARELGLAPKELKKNPLPSGGVGSSFPTWRSTVPILGGVLDLRGKQPKLWGGMFALDPVFTDVQPPATLLGRSDFFRCFTITFDEDAAQPTFTLRERHPRP
jgi:hypothetical protein